MFGGGILFIRKYVHVCMSVCICEWKKNNMCDWKRLLCTLALFVFPRLHIAKPVRPVERFDAPAAAGKREGGQSAPTASSGLLTLFLFDERCIQRRIESRRLLLLVTW